MFFERSDRSRARRRGVVLILILGMLSLMALIGVTFATFAGQSLVNTRNFAAGVNWPGSEQLMDYALAQLINDTNNPLSAIRGHSLLRDMYGNDSNMGRRFDAFSGNFTGSAASVGGLITSLPGNTPMVLSNPVVLSQVATKPFNFANAIRYTTNIPAKGTNSAFYSLDFTRWIVRIPGSGGAQTAPPLANPVVGTVTATFEVLEDDSSGAVHLLTLSPIDPPDSFGQATRVYNNPQVPNMQQVTGNWVPNTGLIYPVQPPLNNNTTVPFYLDGRYMRAFNGPGMSAFNFVGMPDATYGGAGHPHNSAAYANFLYNGNLLQIPFLGNWSPTNLPAVPGPAFGDPSLVGMDEDYDACDLENWFLALQSADGSVMIPSFHRPGILTAADWTNTGAGAVMSKSKILRPRAVDNYAPSFPPDPSVPDANGRLKYDIDNDGDGVTDSVWLDLGYPALRDPRGTTFKPLFAFMVLGLNGRLPLNTAGNLQSRDFQRVTGSTAPGAGAPNPYDFPTNGAGTSFALDAAPQNFIDGATWSHASHLGYSVNEVNPMFALQNAPNLVYGGGTYGVTSNFTQFDGFTTTAPGPNPPAVNVVGDTNLATKAGIGNQYNSRVLGNAPYTWSSAALQLSTTTAPLVVNPGIGVDVIQLRNLLAGTIPQPNLTNNTNSLNQEKNFFQVGGQSFFVPDGMYEPQEDVNNTGVITRRGITPVPGRWGEPNGIPTVLDNNSGTTNPFPVVKNSPAPPAAATLTSIYPVYTNPVRAGKSAINWNSAPYLPVEVGDVGDDDFDSFDFFPISGALLSGGEGGTTLSATMPPYVTLSTGDFYDGTSGFVLPVERIRRFYSPIDAMGVGLVRGWGDKPPINAYDQGNGFDSHGRVMFFRYFRPAGMPKQVVYQTANLTSNYTLTNATTMAAQLQEQQVLNQPVMAGPLLDPAATPPVADTTTNLWHGFQSMLSPIVGIAGGSVANTNADARVAVASAMPYDVIYNAGAASTPVGYAYASSATAPLYPSLATGPATMTSAANTGQGPLLVSPDTANYNNPPTVPGGTVNNPYAVSGTTNIASVVNGYPTYPAFRDVVSGATNTQIVVPSASLNKDEADEMNLYSPNPFDMPFGPADLEWLYRLHDVDGAQLSSRLGSLAPVSFLNPQDGLTRRRMFSVDTAETINWAYAPDNPLPVAYDYVTSFNVNGLNPNSYNAFTDPNFAYNSRFVAPFYNPNAALLSPNANFSAINYNPSPANLSLPPYQNPIAIHAYPNPLSYPRSSATIAFDTTTNTWQPSASQRAPIVTPSVGSRDRKINLNYPLPVSNDPAEPVRQKWVREAYQYFKTILPPQAIDTPQELAQLSQFCVNIVDFRDPDCSHTRFVNTDLMVLPATATVHSQLIFADRIPPSQATGNVHYAFDPSIYDEQVRAYQPQSGQALTLATAVGLQTYWSQGMQYPAVGGVPAEFLVQHGMEYNPLALNEVLAYEVPTKAGGGGGGGGGGGAFVRIAVEVLNTITDEGTVPGGGAGALNSASDLNTALLDGWDFVLMNDGFAYSRPDPTTGELPLPGLLNAAKAYPTSSTATMLGIPPTSYQAIISGLAAGAVPTPPTNIFPLTPTTNLNGMRAGGPQRGAGGAYYQFGWTSAAAGGAGYPTENPVFPTNDASFPNTFGPPPLTPGSTVWCWLYLRRPANPFDTRPYAYREMVTVDAIRFPMTYTSNNGKTVNNQDQVNTVISAFAPNGPMAQGAMFSVQRLQPYRGGHLVPPLSTNTQTANTANDPVPATCWGYSEQTASGTYQGGGGASTGMTVSWGTATGLAVIPHTFAITGGVPNQDGRNTVTDAPWDYFPFNDRDFTGVAELLLVPGCPPGLFTKQFVENDNAQDTNTPISTTTQSYLNPAPKALAAPPLLTYPPPDQPKFTQNVPRSFPYLVDKFFYSAASVLPAQSGASPPPLYPNLVGTWTGDGWYKMLEFVEVPSSANGAVGTVAAGDNFDWFRQDVKPGLLNLNLIIDEEVFFGLMDDLRLNDSLNTSFTPPPNLLFEQPTLVPRIVTQIDQFGYPVVSQTGANNGFHRISDVLTLNPTGVVGNPVGRIGRGFTHFDANGNELHGIKAAFSDFLKLRAGGSGFLYAWGSGTTGSGPMQLLNTVTPSNLLPAWMTNIAPAPYTPQPGLLQFSPQTGLVTQGTPVARERPFRSFSAANIDDTILRPATLPPSNMTYPPMTYPTPNSTDLAGNPLPYQYQFADPAGNPQAPYVPTPATSAGAPAWPTYVMDPGIRNPFLARPSLYSSGTAVNDFLNYSKLPPPIPLRRLFQVPDVANGVVITGAGANHHYSGAAEYLFGQMYPNGIGYATGDYFANTAIYHEQLFNQSSDLILSSRSILPPGSLTLTPVPVNSFLGASITGPPPPPGTNDNREHPYFRTELLQKVMNLTTVRTHQFAVWVTIGFFEVLKPGSPALGVPDVLGGEIGLAGGKNVRYRSFFLLDRTRATGFDPYEPGDFRDVVVYRRRIE